MPTTPRPKILTNPGYLFRAPFATPKPAMTSAGGTFVDPWPDAFVPLGATNEGSTLNYSSNVEAIEAAEFFDPLEYATTSRAGNLSFALLSWTLTNLQRAMNGGSLAVVSGTGPTQVSRFAPPKPGEETRCVIGWESQDSQLRIIAEQCFNASELAAAFQKAPNKAVIACQFNFEIPASGDPFEIFAAGSNRA